MKTILWLAADTSRKGWKGREDKETVIDIVQSGYVFRGLMPKLEDYVEKRKWIEEGDRYRKILQCVFERVELGAGMDLKTALL